MTLQKINLMDAIMIETVRSNGISNEELIEKALNKDVDDLKNLSTDFDFERLIELAENEEIFKSIIHDGYQVSFVTRNGLKNLLKLKFQITEGDYEQIENGYLNLEIHEDTLDSIREMISANWKIREIERNDSKVKVNITVG